METVYQYNVTPKDDATALTAPAILIYIYQACIKGFDVAPPSECKNPRINEVGDAVWIKAPSQAMHDAIQKSNGDGGL